MWCRDSWSLLALVALEGVIATSSGRLIPATYLRAPYVLVSLPPPSTDHKSAALKFRLLYPYNPAHVADPPTHLIRIAPGLRYPLYTTTPIGTTLETTRGSLETFVLPISSSFYSTFTPPFPLLRFTCEPIAPPLVWGGALRYAQTTCVWFTRIAPPQLPISSSELVRALRALPPLRAAGAANAQAAERRTPKGSSPTPRILSQQ
ncbi:hypothetical protein B0H19DRAFT_1080972 [Mycena capillaripes]|nr:hypothetical protein B0H19DRAFT_1080972 [Mycena capillaripes]